MAHAETCPICWGSGKVQDPDGLASETKTCRGCGGSGWVSVQDEAVGWPAYTLPYPSISMTPRLDQSDLVVM